MFHWISKARKGERIGGKYIWRWWKNDRWNYKYSDIQHPHHGLINSAVTTNHSVKAHPKAIREELNPEEAFHFSRKQLLKNKRDDAFVLKTSSGVSKYKVVVKPSFDRPFIVLPANSDRISDAIARLPSIEALENWARRITTTKTVKDVFGKPWFDVRERGVSGKEAPSGRMMVRYHSTSPYNPFPKDDLGWIPSPFRKIGFNEWVRD